MSSTHIPESKDIVNSLNPEEKKWLKKFYHGVLFFDGWKNISQQILGKFPPHEKARHKAFVDELGMKIGIEWSRDNKVRRIDTCMLKDWGKQLRNAAKESSNKLTHVLQSIDKEVDKVLRD